MNITKKVTLTLTTGQWQHKLSHNQCITSLSKKMLLSAMNSFTKRRFPPIETIKLTEIEFGKMQNEIEAITLDETKLFIIRNNSFIYLTDEKSPNWDEPKWIPGEDCDEGWPADPDNHIFVIRNWHNEVCYAKVDFSQEETSEGIRWLTLEGKPISRLKITGWFRIY